MRLKLYEFVIVAPVVLRCSITLPHGRTQHNLTTNDLRKKNIENF
jgi:hypothetical protein